jgi:hypothetical protein
MRQLVVAIFVLFCILPTAQAQFSVNTFTASNGGVSVSGYVAYVDFTNPGITPVVTAPLATSNPCAATGEPVQLTSTVLFATAQKTLFAINANLGPSMSDTIYATQPCGNPYGLLKNAGRFLSPVDQLGSGPSYGPSLYFPTAMQAMIGMPSPARSVGAQYAISGWIGPQDCGSAPPGTLLVTSDKNTGSTAFPVPTTTAPRTAAGINVKNSVLIFVVVTGIEPNSGLTLPGLADLMIGLGSDSAVNLDGGGSSTFVWTPGTFQNTVPASVQTVIKSIHNSGTISGITLTQAASPCYSVPHAQPATPLCQGSGLTGYRNIYANFGYVLSSTIERAK